MKKRILTMLVKYFNLKGFLTEMVTEVADEALEEVVQDSANPYDNMAKAAMWPTMEEKLAEVIAKKVNVEKWLGLEEDS